MTNNLNLNQQHRAFSELRDHLPARIFKMAEEYQGDGGIDDAVPLLAAGGKLQRALTELIEVIEYKLDR
ncbi:MAG: hypothetical protein Q4B10_07930 [Actinomycetaceae bacterium]|nr:hypothetical protein [Actinomycetaceae bacterium]